MRDLSTLPFLWRIQCTLLAHMAKRRGKKALGIKVVRENGGKVNFHDAVIREILGKFLSGIIFGLGFIWILFDAKKQGWHDKIAKTVVIRA